MPTAIRVSLPRGLRFVGLGIAYVFSLATSSAAAANVAPADGPIEIIHCRHFPSRSRLSDCFPRSRSTYGRPRLLFRRQPGGRSSTRCTWRVFARNYDRALLPATTKSSRFCKSTEIVCGDGGSVFGRLDVGPRRSATPIADSNARHRRKLGSTASLRKAQAGARARR
jgi:hypothetical protein